MPYTYEKSGNKWVVKKADTGEVLGHTDTESGAKAMIRAIYANTNEPNK